MACTCGADCTTSCEGHCAFYCSDGRCDEGCYTSCYGGCSRSCADDCTGGCSRSCADNCSSTCQGGCGNDCNTTCTATCADNCSGSCKNSCSTACNTTCSGQTQTTNINKLAIDDYFKASDISNIITAANFEAQNRRGLTLAHNVKISSGELLDDTKINQIINVIKQSGQTPNRNAVQDETAFKALAQELINKIKLANSQQINL